MKAPNQVRPNQVRIIGGRWRSRRVRCASVVELRPSPDAVRETLFNWLPHHLHDKHCLDLFAGSGAFGFESASRGAAEVVMVESNRKAVAMLRANRAALNAPAVTIVADKVERFLTQRPRPSDLQFDLVFIDPPFAADAIAATCAALAARGFLRARALVYVESPSESTISAQNRLPLPRNWRIIRERRRGQVQSTLIQT